MNQHHMVKEALTTAGDHDTPCERCGMNDADACFWFVKGFHLHMLGQQVQARNSVMHNTNVHYYLYGQFVDDEYSYLCGPTEVQCHLPHLPLPYCIEDDIKRFFPNEDNRPFMGFQHRIRGRGAGAAKRNNI